MARAGAAVTGGGKGRDPVGIRWGSGWYPVLTLLSSVFPAG